MSLTSLITVLDVIYNVINIGFSVVDLSVHAHTPHTHKDFHLLSFVVLSFENKTTFSERIWTAEIVIQHFSIVKFYESY